MYLSHNSFLFLFMSMTLLRSQIVFSVAKLNFTASFFCASYVRSCLIFSQLRANVLVLKIIAQQKQNFLYGFKGQQN